MSLTDGLVFASSVTGTINNEVTGTAPAQGAVSVDTTTPTRDGAEVTTRIKWQDYTSFDHEANDWSLEFWYLRTRDSSGSVFFLPDFRFWHQGAAAQNIKLVINGNYVNTSITGNMPPQDQWIHGVMTWDASTHTSRAYSDGSLNDERQSSDFASQVLANLQAPANGFLRLWNVKLYDRKLQPEEISSLYNGGSGRTYTDLTTTSTTYTVSGTVTDSGGTAIQGATVSLENVTGAAQTTDTTDASGNYSISVTLEDADLPDTWDVVASSSGYTEQLKQVSASTSSTSYTTDFSLSPKYSLAPNSLSQTHTLGAPGVAAAFTLAPNDSAHGHTLGAGGLNVAYGLTPNGLAHSHTLDGTAIGTGVLLTPNDVQHGHTLDPSSVAVAFTVSPNDAGHTHTLNAGGVNVAYALTPNRLQQGHTLANTGLDTGLVLSPNDVQHGHTLEASSVTVAFTVSPNDSTQGHTLTGSGLDVTYALTPQGVQQAHSIAETGASVAYTLSPNGLLHPQRVAVSGVSVAYVLSPRDTQHEHLLGAPVLIVKGNAERASLEAVPIYQISLSAEPSPELNVTLSATPTIKDN